MVFEMKSHAHQTQQNNHNQHDSSNNITPKHKEESFAYAKPNQLMSLPGASSNNIQLSPQNIAHLQNTIGNRAVGRLIQAKMKIGKSNDKYEQEADSVADQVMRMPAPAITRQPEKDEEEAPIQAKPIADQITPLIQRQPEDEENTCQAKHLIQREENEEELQAKPLIQQQDNEEEDDAQAKPQGPAESEYEVLQEKSLTTNNIRFVQMSSEKDDELQLQPLENEEEPVQPKSQIGKSNEVSSDLGLRINAMRTSGQPLQETDRAYFEPRFGLDLSQVRLHTDSNATEAASELKAQAFTRGNDIFMGAGKYQANTDSGKHLLAHELTHVVQQKSPPPQNISGISQATFSSNSERSNTLYRKSAGIAGTTGAETSKQKSMTAPGIMDFKGMKSIKPDVHIDQWLEEQEEKSGNVKVRFGKVAKGTVDIKKSDEQYELTKKSFLAFTHPVFRDIPEGLQPGLVLEKGPQVNGYIAIRSGSKIPSARGLRRVLKEGPDLIGLNGFDFDSLPAVTNRLESGNLKLGLKGVPITMGRVFSGKVSIEADDERITVFDGNVTVNVKGLKDGNLELKRSETGLITGRISLGVDLPKDISGSVDVAWDGRAVTGEGKVGYQGEKLSGEVALKIMERSKAEKLEREKKAPPEAKSEKSAKASNSQSKKSGKVNYAVFGEGDLNFAFTEWLNGTAHVIVDSKGFVTIIGKITPQKEFELFPQKDYNKKLFKIEARASYGIPVVGNIFIFANVGMDAFAKLGPAKFYKIEIGGTYSTDPEKCKSFSIKGSLNISAAAGLRLRGEAGAGLEVLAHDIKAGAGINGIAGIRGYAEATPTIGYREKQAEKGADKKGEFFIRGDMEIAAQPFLGLSGDLFVEIDAPWWSPVPDKKWTWPLGGIEYPLGGSMGVGASIDYVFGSGKIPELEFKKVDFSADKFMTDLYSDKAKGKSGGGKDKKQGKWKEKNTKDASPPSKKRKKGGADVGKPSALPPAKSKVKTGGTAKTVKPADPNARTAEGKTVKDYQNEAARKGKKQDTKDLIKGSEKKEIAKGKTKHDKQLKKGLAALSALTNRYAQDGATKQEIKAGIKSVRRKFKVFKSIIAVDGGNKWKYKYTCSPEQTMEGPDIRSLPDSVITYTGTSPGGYFGKTMIANPLTLKGEEGKQPSSSLSNDRPWCDLKLRKEGGRTYYCRGHLLNHNVHGPGNTWKNLTPIRQVANRDHENTVESKVKDKVSKGKTLFYQVTALYNRRVNGSLLRKIKSSDEPESRKAIKKKIVKAETYIPNELLCIAYTIDPTTKKKKDGLDIKKTIENTIEETNPQEYQINDEEQKREELYYVVINDPPAPRKNAIEAYKEFLGIGRKAANKLYDNKKYSSWDEVATILYNENSERSIKYWKNKVQNWKNDRLVFLNS